MLNCDALSLPGGQSLFDQMVYPLLHRRSHLLAKAIAEIDGFFG